MILRYGVSNFYSISDYQEVSFIATSLKDNIDFLCEVDGFKHKVLPVIALYGANASGKTNILKALRYMINGILTSHIEGPIEGGIKRPFYKLDDKYISLPTKFDIDFIHNKVRYHFGYTIDNERVTEEWLYAYPTGSKQVWYYRKAGEPIIFGRFLKGKNKVIESMTRDNSLYISVAAQNNNDQLLEVYKYFKENFVFSFNKFEPFDDISVFLSVDEIKDIVVSFLKHADTGIMSARVNEIEPPEEVSIFNKKLLELIEGNAKFKLKSNLSKKAVEFSHRGIGGNEIFLDFNSESRGTRALIKLLGPIIVCLAKGMIIVIDELDTSLHSLLSVKLINLFNNHSSNHNCSQLFFSTHDTSLLSNKVLRRDEIWFSEKNLDGSTELQSLAEIKSRQTDNFEAGYLQGRYGGIPYLGDLDGLFSFKEDK